MSGTPRGAEEAIALLQEAAHRLAVAGTSAGPDTAIGAAGDGDSAASARPIGDLLAAVERATPLGVGVHARLDAVRKWLAVLGQPAEHARFGGAEHLRGHLVGQLRLAEAAVRDYFGAQP